MPATPFWTASHHFWVRNSVRADQLLLLGNHKILPGKRWEIAGEAEDTEVLQSL